MQTLVCPNNCGKTYEAVHESDEVGHKCPKAKIGARLVWLVPAPKEVTD